MLPLIATDPPKLSPAAPSDAVSVAVGLLVVAQPVPGSVYTQAAPGVLLVPGGPGAPTTTVLPLIATDAPKLSPATPSVSVAFGDQLEPDPVNTYATPELLPTEPAATSVLPLMATAMPNQ
jgi:hypothetical protein